MGGEGGMMEMSGRRGWGDGMSGRRGGGMMEMSGRRGGEGKDGGDEWEERRKRVG